MFFFNKKRTDSTYLKYQNGKIISLGKDERLSSSNTGGDTGANTNELEVEVNNGNIQESTNLPQNKKSKILLIAGVCIILIPLAILGFKAFNKSIGNVSDYMGTNSENVEVEQVNNEVKSNKTDDKSNSIFAKTEPSANKETKADTSEMVKEPTDSKLNQSISLDSITSKFSPETVVLYSNKVDTNMTYYYTLVKTEVILFYDSKESAYTTSKNINAIKIIVNKDYQSILSKESAFEKENQKDLYLTMKNRYINLLNTIGSISSDVARVTCSSNFNNGLDSDNKLCIEQQKSMSSYLNANGINFEILDNVINIK